MKQIKINNITRPQLDPIYVRDKKYCVYLGNQNFNYFTSEKHSLAFLANTNRFLNECLQIINHIYIQVFSEYRQVWFYGDTCQNTIIKIEQEFKQIEYGFENVISKSSHPINGNSYAFSILNHLCNSHRLIVENIIQIYTTKKIYVPIHRLRYLKSQIDIIDNKINTYGSEEIKKEIDSFIEIDYEN